MRNIGLGRLELVGTQLDDERALASQLIQRTDGGLVERRAAFFSMNDEHSHWHLDSFARFELFATGIDSVLGASMAVEEKVTFCLLDEKRIEPRHAKAVPTAQYVGCDWRFQGLSAGWEETYYSYLPGQSLDITGLPDGLYVLGMTLDPEDILLEADEGNNSSFLFLRIEGDEVLPLRQEPAIWP